MRLRWLVCALALSAHAWAAEPAAAGAAEPPAAGSGEPPAAEAEDAEARLAQAKARYEQGVEAYAAGRFKDAVDLFLDADRMSPSAPLSFNIARAYEKLGDDSGALRWYRDYLRRSPQAPNAKAVEELVLRFEARLARKGVQQLTVLSAPPGATVAIDDAPVGVTPWTGDLSPGPHRVSLTLRGYTDVASEIELARDRAQDLSLSLVEAPASAGDAGAAVVPLAAAPQAAPATGAAQSDSKATKSSGFGIWPWVTLGAGGAALGAGLVFELLRQSSEEAAQDETTQIGYKEKFDEMASRRTTARVLAGVGGALVVAGGTLLLIEMGGKKSKHAAALTWSITPASFDAQLSGSF